MKHRSILLLAGIVIILLFVVLITRRENVPKSIVAVDKLKMIRIERPSDTTEIEIGSGKYRLVKPVDYFADSIVVSELLNSLKSLILGEVISNRAEKFSDFEVDTGGIKVVLKGDRDIAFYIGKYAGDYQNSYLRFVNEKRVYLAKGLNKYQVDRKVDDWRDKTILRIDRSLINKIALDEKEIYCRDTLWFFKDIVIDKSKVENLLNNFSNLRAIGFSDTSVFYAKRSITVYAGTTEYPIELGEKRGYAYLVRRPGNNTIFLVSEWIITSLEAIFPVDKKEKKN